MKKILPVGGHVEVLRPNDLWVPAEVIDLLSAQFTADVDGRILYYFYADKDVTWRQLSEDA